MDCMILVLSKVDQIYSVLLAVQSELLCSLLAVVDDDLVVAGAGDDVHAIIAVVQVGDLVLVVSVQLRHPHGPYQRHC